MALPFAIADAKSLIPDPSSSLCGNFIGSLLRLPVFFYQLCAYLFDSSGNPTKALVNQSLKTGSYVFSGCLQTEDGTILLCDGRDVSQTTYPDLYAKFGVIYGTSTAGNFKLPDWRDRFPIGVGTIAVIGAKGGEATHASTAAENGAHTHAATIFKTSVQRGSADTEVLATSDHGSGSFTLAATASSGSGTPANNLPPFMGAYVYVVT